MGLLLYGKRPEDRVGKVEFMSLHPLSFDEFLHAMGKGRFADMLRDDITMASEFRETYIELLAQYYYVGGMPEPVFAFSQRHDFKEARSIQQRILDAYEQDFSKHAPNDTVPRLRMLWQSVPSQLACENRRFTYGRIKPGGRASEYELAMQWLLDCGLVHKVHRISKPDVPLTAYADLGAFKLYMVDVGLLSAKCGLDTRTLLDGSRVFEEFKGALAEQYVLQQLVSSGVEQVCYWSPDSGTAEVDFVIQQHGEIYPIEVKGAENLQAKSLKLYRSTSHAYASALPYPAFAGRTGWSTFHCTRSALSIRSWDSRGLQCSSCHLRFLTCGGQPQDAICSDYLSACNSIRVKPAAVTDVSKHVRCGPYQHFLVLFMTVELSTPIRNMYCSLAVQATHRQNTRPAQG